ncbi:hypothetical protein HU200_042349 [Digitaria exilis]|uniref:Uncharacterized protein n=1 Tax=Digitaria exilis TaxID=1010633 RepID=A0A835B662_9POAL|nr:hypothetical protein HU200_042349 [Digitaria exilis]CAB3504358.1 unnamed protein product [Digitaria exilis]
MATVEVLTSELVVPSDKTPAGAVWLSNLDLAARRGYTPTVYFYRPDGEPGLFAPDVIKDSLARALVPFYPLAGRLGLDATGRLQVDCTGEGVLFVTARSEYVLDDLINDFVPCTEMRDLFVPPEPSPSAPCVLLLVQVTSLRCGGMVLGLAAHHTLIDARSAAHFVETWASIARGSNGDNIPASPCFDHELLRARPVPTVLYDHPEYKAEEPAPTHALTASSTSTTYASALITLTKAEVSAIKARCEVASTFRAVVALVWQCACRARSLPPEAETRLYSMVDVRPRMSPPLPPGYFGNAVIRTSAVATVEEVVSNPVGHAARRLRTATSQGDEYVRSLVDYLEGVDTMNLPRSGISRAHLRAISWMGMSLHDADFGWGAPAFMGPALMYYSGFLHVLNAAGKDNAVTLALSLEPESMPEFRKVFTEELARLQQQ